MDLEAARARLLKSLAREINDTRVIDAMARVRREDFVPSSSRHLAYEDIPLPIGRGQTISQPYIVALMTQALSLEPEDKVLEVGTGSGYQAAILSLLAGRIVSVERQRPLAEAARELLGRLGHHNVDVRDALNGLGSPEDAPYDAIIVTAGAPGIPQALLEQLADKGRLVIPAGSRYNQDLLLVTKAPGHIRTQNLGPCRFVPLVGEGGWPEEE